MKRTLLLLTVCALAAWLAAATWAHSDRAAVAPTAYADVKADGTLWPAHTTGVSGVEHPRRGLYCLKLASPAKSAVGSANPAAVAGTAVVMPFLPGGPSGGISLSGCPSGFHGASVLVKNGAGSDVDAGFYILFTS